MSRDSTHGTGASSPILSGSFHSPPSRQDSNRHVGSSRDPRAPSQGGPCIHTFDVLITAIVVVHPTDARTCAAMEDGVKESRWKTFFKRDVVGDYDYKFLCMPHNPFGKKHQSPPPFFGHSEKLSLFVAMLMGLQHSLAMLGGVITPPLIISGAFDGNFTPDKRQYVVAAALLASGVFTALTVIRLKLFGSDRLPGGPYYIGTGLLSVMGVSFTFLPIFQSSIRAICGEDGVPGCQGTEGETAYGRLLGTVCVCALLEVFLSFVPARLLRKVVPNFVAGITVALIGVGLIGTGVKYWGGGAFCADNSGRGTATDFAPGTFFFDQATESYVPMPVQPCTNNGDTNLPYGSPEYWGLGLLVTITLVVVEIFGSPFLRNCNVIIALVVGYIVAVCTKVDGNNYVTSEQFDNAKVATFFWVETFPLGFYWPAIIPLLIAFLVTTVESIGDISATCEASMMDVEHERIQGGLLADGVYSILSALCMTMPNTTFSQNNGVISLTRCASVYAGIACGVWLFVMGIFGYIAAVISSIPDAVLGGMTTFLFSNVFISGIRIICSQPITRRIRFILAISFGLGIGVALVPGFGGLAQRGRLGGGWGVASGHLWPPRLSYSTAMTSFQEACIIALSTPYCVGTVVAILLNLILPKEAVEDEEGGVKTYQLPSNVISRVEEPDTQKEVVDSPPDSENGKMEL